MPNATQLVQEFTDGKVLLFDKPLYWTSFNVVSKVKSLLRHRLGLKKIKVGHAGTLDPMATGLLVICTGKMTKQIESYQASEKEYTGTFYIGATTPSYDLETNPDKEYPTDHIHQALVDSAVKSLSGKIMQVPPVFSAVKIEGKRAYSHARKGEEITLKAREINISEFEVDWEEPSDAHFRVVCSKGTYIRSLARDLGLALQSGAYLKSLRRTRIGAFHVDNAVSVDQFTDYMNLTGM